MATIGDFHPARNGHFRPALTPLIDELPMALECEVISYDPETCRLVGRIVNVSADESVLGENGKVDVGKLRPITFDTMNNQYLVLGEKVGQALHDGVQLK